MLVSGARAAPTRHEAPLLPQGALDLLAGVPASALQQLLHQALHQHGRHFPAEKVAHQGTAVLVSAAIYGFFRMFTCYEKNFPSYKQQTFFIMFSNCERSEGSEILLS